MIPTAASSPRSPAQNVRITLGLVVIISFLFVPLVAHKEIFGEPDLWWHIKTGIWILENRAFPTSDPFSYTFAGFPWMAKEWLSQVLYALAFKAGGWSAVATLATIAVGLGTAALYGSLSSQLRPSVAAAATILTLFITSSTITIRPHLLTLPLVVLWAHILFQASRQGKAPSFLVLAILVLWANLHAAFTMGFVIAGFAFLDFVETTRLKDRRETAKWVLFLVLCPLTTILHPYTYQAMLATLLVFRPSEGTLLIDEWQPLNAQIWPIHAAVVIGLAYSAVMAGFRLGIARSLLLALLTFLFFQHLRYAFFLFPVMAVVVAPGLAEQFSGLSAKLWRERELDPVELRMSTAFRPLAIGLCAVIAAMLAIQTWIIRPEPPQEVAATAAIAFVKSHGLSGHVFNDYGFGGPLILNDIPTFIDGRSDQLFVGEISNVYDASEKDPKALADLLRKHDVRWTIFPTTNPRVKLLDGLPGWKRVFSDKFATIHQLQDQVTQ
jgi:hypothetical protein